MSFHHLFFSWEDPDKLSPLVPGMLRFGGGGGGGTKVAQAQPPPAPAPPHAEAPTQTVSQILDAKFRPPPTVTGSLLTTNTNQYVGAYNRKTLLGVPIRY